MSNQYSEVISQEILANDLLFLSPQETGNISLSLMTSLLNASNYLDVHVLDRLTETIAEIAQENPEMSDYLILVTRNSEHYAKLNEIYSDDKTDSKRIIINLAENERKNEQEKEKCHQNELENKERELKITTDENDKLKAEKTELSKKFSYLRKKSIDNAKGEMKAFERKVRRRLAICELSSIVGGSLEAVLTALFLPKVWAKIIGIVVGIVGIVCATISIYHKYKSCSMESDKRIQKKKIEIAQKYGLNIIDI